MTDETFEQAARAYGDMLYRVAYHALKNRADAEEVFQAVMALDAKYRLSVYLYYYEGCSVKEAAAAMGVNPSTVQTWLQRARGRLRKTLSEAEEEGKGEPICTT